ncbi:hypothetical protein BpHYR1_048557 [Brachionus plicatilis]|uniref:Uncharacterized protein n=1 Tax=Brachionus plicatilis TaxID=10195 RepID=A0A3M7SJK6_BRAPC|nr:hypothetical protein BpHYR1_048557 [Brachionus plicatilis]
MSKLKERNFGESFFSVVRVRNPKFLTFELLCSPKKRSLWQKLKALELRSQLGVKERVARVLAITNITRSKLNKKLVVNIAKVISQYLRTKIGRKFSPNLIIELESTMRKRHNLNTILCLFEISQLFNMSLELGHVLEKGKMIKMLKFSNLAEISFYSLVFEMAFRSGEQMFTY